MHAMKLSLSHKLYALGTYIYDRIINFFSGSGSVFSSQWHALYIYVVFYAKSSVYKYIITGRNIKFSESFWKEYYAVNAISHILVV